MSANLSRPTTNRPTLGVLAGWQFYWTATPLSYLRPLFSGIVAAAHDEQCNLLLACGIGSSATASDPPHPAWPLPDPETDFVPVGPWNTHGLIFNILTVAVGGQWPGNPEKTTTFSQTMQVDYVRVYQRP